MSPHRSDKAKASRFEPYETEAERKKREQLALAVEIENTGHEMIPCSHCAAEHRKCVLATEKASRCSECIRAKIACDAVIPLAESWDSEVPRVSAWQSIDRQMEQLDDEEEIAAQMAEAVMSSAIAKHQEAMAKVHRLRKQKAFLKARRKEMLRRGLRYLDELDAAEKKEAEEKAAQEASSSSLATANAVPEFDSSLLDLPDLSDPIWANLGSFDGTPEASSLLPGS